MFDKRWILWYLAVIGALWIAAWSTTDAFDQLLFNPATVASVTGLLMPLLIVATFIERAVEVYVATSREPAKVELKRAAEKGGDDEKEALEKYKCVTAQKAFLAALGLGTVVAIVGVRVLYPLVNHDHALEGLQGRLFGLVDVALTGALLSGGAEPIHKIMTLITGYLDQWRPQD